MSTDALQPNRAGYTLSVGAVVGSVTISVILGNRENHESG